jgi:hypothetical protein
MKYILSGLVILIIVSISYKLCFPGGSMSKQFEAAVNQQQNPFTVANDKAEEVWKRAPEFLLQMKHLIYGGRLHKTDTFIYVPYIPGLSFHKGDSISILKRINKDSTSFYTAWFSYDNADSFAAKELAYYMHTGISRYDK